MAIKILSSPNELSNLMPVAYFKNEYVQSQSYNQFIGFNDDHYCIWFDLEGNKAISIPRSPFGSIFCHSETSNDSLSFLREVIKELQNRNISELEIHLPASFYEGFESVETYLKCDFDIKYSDLNQHIELNNSWQNTIHKMQQRKLASLNTEGFIFRKMDDNELETAHKFITVCRQTQGLQINITWDKLKLLNDRIPGTYECFGVFREEKISAVSIAVNVTKDIAYYYLPATSPMFRNQSPMVLLIAGMVEYYQSKGFKYLDLGVSSLNGDVQETLKLFKERMGAKNSEKATMKRFL